MSKKNQPPKDKIEESDVKPDEKENPSQTVLEMELEQLRKEASDYKEKYFRSLAESENTRKRMMRDHQEGVKSVMADTMMEFLRPLDQLEKALGFAEASSEEVKNWAMGFEMILSQFKEALATHNIFSFDSLHRPFDPHFHEAVEMIETDEHPEGTILEELQRGYKMGDRILRPAHVKVAKGPEKETDVSKKDQKNQDNKNRETKDD